MSSLEGHMHRLPRRKYMKEVDPGHTNYVHSCLWYIEFHSQISFKEPKAQSDQGHEVFIFYGKFLDASHSCLGILHIWVVVYYILSIFTRIQILRHAIIALCVGKPVYKQTSSSESLILAKRSAFYCISLVACETSRSNGLSRVERGQPILFVALLLVPRWLSWPSAYQFLSVHLRYHWFLSQIIKVNFQHK